MDTGDDVVASVQSQEHAVDPHKPPPSKVLHLRGVPDNVMSSELMALIGQYGNVACITIMSRIRQALVEMATIDEAINVFMFAQQNPLTVQGKVVYINYSKSTEINRGNVSNAPAHESAATKIILMTIINPLYPVTTEVIHTICSPFGFVERIVIFRKNGVQALVEFDSIMAASQARNSLQGADIYAGCCTLKIEFSRTDRLNVRRNNEDTFDYTTSLPRGMMDQQSAYNQQQRHGVYSHSHMGGRGQGMMQQQQQQQGGGGYGLMSASSPACIVYGLNPQYFNCDRLFNLACLYGNVIKIKFLVSKPGSALVQFSDCSEAAAFASNANGAPAFENTIDIRPSKHAYIAGTRTDELLADGSLASIDYSRTSHNRFTRTNVRNYHRFFPPSKVLHFFGIPGTFGEIEIKEAIGSTGSSLPKAIKFFDKPGDMKSGLMEWDDVSQATEALVLANHAPMDSGQSPHMLKLAFSQASSAQ